MPTGEATRGQIEQHFESLAVKTLKPADLAPTPRGLPRWKIMIRDARKPMEREGFLEPGAGAQWRISAQGRRAADGARGPSRRRALGHALWIEVVCLASLRF